MVDARQVEIGTIADYDALLTSLARDRAELPDVRHVALSVLGPETPHDALAIALRLAEWMRETITYRPEAGEQIEAPEYVLSMRQADCDGQSCCLASLAWSVGVELHFAWWAEAPNQDPVHVSCVYVDRNGPVDLDTTPREPGDGAGWAVFSSAWNGTVDGSTLRVEVRMYEQTGGSTWPSSWNNGNGVGCPPPRRPAAAEREWPTRPYNPTEAAMNQVAYNPENARYVPGMSMAPGVTRQILNYPRTPTTSATRVGRFRYSGGLPQRAMPGMGLLKRTGGYPSAERGARWNAMNHLAVGWRFSAYGRQTYGDEGSIDFAQNVVGEAQTEVGAVQDGGLGPQTLPLAIARGQADDRQGLSSASQELYQSVELVDPNGDPVRNIPRDEGGGGGGLPPGPLPGPSPAPSPTPTSGGLSTGAKVAIAGGVLVGAYLLTKGSGGGGAARRTRTRRRR